MNKQSGRLESAFSYMISLIDEGYEYPDAQWKAAYKFSVDCSELEQLYDEQ